MEGQEQSLSQRWDWERLERKHAYGINIDKASDEQAEEYVLTKIHVYEKNNFTDYSLWETFAEDFAKFEVDNFKILRSATKTKLRLFLISRGVFVSKRTNKLTLYQVLYDTAREEEQHKWTDEELIEALAEIGEPMITKTLRKRLNPSRTELRTEEKEHSKEARSQQSQNSLIEDQYRDSSNPDVSLS
jgi:hypothetical protein